MPTRSTGARKSTSTAKAAPQPARPRKAAAGRRSAAASGTAASEPSWREPPARPRSKMRPRQTGVSSKTIRPAPKPQVRLRLPESTSGFLLRLGLAAAVVLLLGLGLSQVLRLPAWTVSATSTEVGGNHRVSAQQIYVASQVDGQSIFWLRLGRVAERVQALPGIASAAVHLRLPNRVVIDVQEVEPLVAWAGVTETRWYTTDGVEIPPEGEMPPLLLSDRSGAPSASEDSLRFLLPHLAALRQADPDLRHVYYGPLEGLYFVTAEGWTVYLGDTGSMADKMAMLDAVRKEIAAQGATPSVIDLRSNARQALWW